MKKLYTFISLTLFSLCLISSEVDRITAEKVAHNFFYERISQFEIIDHASINVSTVFELSLEGKLMLYAINIGDAGYVLVSAHNVVQPVAGYSLKGKFSEAGIPPQMQDLISQYKLQIREAASSQFSTQAEIKAEWNRLLSDHPEDLKPLKLEKNIEPMLTTTWDQGQYYNEMCPADPQGPGGHCYAGCVATALGQVVNYFRWPETGTGSYSYSCPPYGTLTANFGNTTYEWDKMATSLNQSNLAVALLLHHLGIACDMVYGPNGSGMYNHKAAYALHTFFKYSPETVYVYRDSTSMDWDSLLVTHLDRHIPLYYAGWSVPNINGHAFVCDGYQADNYYHFNWGWSGSFDGYFYTSNLNPGGSNFNLAQEVIINGFPDTNMYSYPYFCQGDKTLDGTDGTIDDGSGPVYDYETDATCSWLIAPEDSVEFITLSFLKFNTEAGDMLTVYDGNNTNAPVLGTYQGADLPADVTSSGDAILLSWNTDASGTAPGWLLEYEAEIPTFCIGMTNLTEQSGTFSDGSGPADYHNSTTCMWMIQPPGASEVTVYFNEFNTEEEYDQVKVYDADTQDLLADLSGDITPDPVTSPSGKAFITFSSNYTVTAPGWEIYYETDLVKVEEKLLEENLNIFPNPANDKLHISFTSPSADMLDVSISNMLGQTQHLQEIPVAKGNNIIDINVSDFEAGIYLLRLQVIDEVVYRKIVID